jgi:hypothetical protein
MPGRKREPSFQLASGTTNERDGSYNISNTLGSIFYNTDTSNVEIRHEDPSNTLGWRDLVMNNKEQIDISGNVVISGYLTTPTRPAFYAWDNSTSSSGTTLTFDSTTYNIGSHYNTSTSRFRTPVAGTYIFAAVLAHDYNNTFGSAYYSFYVDGSNHRDILEGMPTHDAHYEKHGVYIVYLNANQYVDIRSRSNHNITFVNGNHGAYYRNCFQGALLG